VQGVLTLWTERRKVEETLPIYRREMKVRKQKEDGRSEQKEMNQGMKARPRSVQAIIQFVGVSKGIRVI